MASLFHSIHIPCIFHAYAMHIHAYAVHLTCIFYTYSMDILCIFHAYSMNIPCICHAYAMHMPCTLHTYPMHILYISHAGRSQSFGHILLLLILCVCIRSATNCIVSPVETFWKLKLCPRQALARLPHDHARPMPWAA